MGESRRSSVGYKLISGLSVDEEIPYMCDSDEEMEEKSSFIMSRNSSSNSLHNTTFNAEHDGHEMKKVTVDIHHDLNYSPMNGDTQCDAGLHREIGLRRKFLKHSLSEEDPLDELVTINNVSAVFGKDVTHVESSKIDLELEEVSDNSQDKESKSDRKLSPEEKVIDLVRSSSPKEHDTEALKYNWLSNCGESSKNSSFDSRESNEEQTRKLVNFRQSSEESWSSRASSEVNQRLLSSRKWKTEQNFKTSFERQCGIVFEEGQTIDTSHLRGKSRFKDFTLELIKLMNQKNHYNIHASPPTALNGQDAIDIMCKKHPGLDRDYVTTLYKFRIFPSCLGSSWDDLLPENPKSRRRRKASWSYISAKFHRTASLANINLDGDLLNRRRSKSGTSGITRSLEASPTVDKKGYESDDTVTRRLDYGHMVRRFDQKPPKLNTIGKQVSNAPPEHQLLSDANTFQGYWNQVSNFILHRLSWEIL